MRCSSVPFVQVRVGERGTGYAPKPRRPYDYRDDNRRNHLLAVAGCLRSLAPVAGAGGVGRTKEAASALHA